MPEEEDTKSTEPTGGSPAAETIDDKLERLQTTVQSESIASSQLAKLVADPQIRQLLEAREAGKKMTLTDADESRKLVPEENESQEPVDLDELSRAELVKFTAKQTVNKMAPIIEERISELAEQITPLRNLVQAGEDDKMKQSIALAQEKFPDFDKHQEKMLQIHKNTGGTLTPEQLYILAKQDAGTLFKDTGKMSEKPDAFGFSESKPSTGKARTHKDFKAMLDEAADNVISNME